MNNPYLKSNFQMLIDHLGKTRL